MIIDVSLCKDVVDTLTFVDSAEGKPVECGMEVCFKAFDKKFVAIFMGDGVSRTFLVGTDRYFTYDTHWKQDYLQILKKFAEV